MKIKAAKPNRGMAILGVILVFAAVAIIMGTLVYILVKALRRLDHKINPPPSAQTNDVSRADVALVYMPAFNFGAIPTPPNYSQAKPIGDCRMYIERSTNLVDWETLYDVTEWTNSFNFLTDDTNAPTDRAFYRSRLSYP